jgi:hypothetical protein
MSATVITVQDYMTVPSKRRLADRIMRAGGLDRDEVFQIVYDRDAGEVTVQRFLRNAEGKFYLVGDLTPRLTLQDREGNVIGRSEWAEPPEMAVETIRFPYRDAIRVTA